MKVKIKNLFGDIYKKQNKHKITKKKESNEAAALEKILFLFILINSTLFTKGSMLKATIKARTIKIIIG